jgi:hypothetical protein
VQMDDNGLPKKILWANPGYQRGCGRPKSRWIDVVEEDEKELACRNWPVDVRDSGRRRHLLEEATANPGL